ncbi:hypothetical protein FSARC_14208 [Fusarium sarcochroum]|uniref:Methyltransferase n=1 Tax=Fusarium sarcochroum TaxID=1208366 RepID=A0A8H4SVB3_9HYPO|nr:hypothetical protein FSARC_14208 [Fusarium sarcochroum]
MTPGTRPQDDSATEYASEDNWTGSQFSTLNDEDEQEPATIYPFDTNTRITDESATLAEYHDEGYCESDNSSTCSNTNGANNFKYICHRRFHDERIGSRMTMNGNVCGIFPKSSTLFLAFGWPPQGYLTTWRSGTITPSIVPWVWANLCNKRVLDVGTGDGGWAMAFADKYPHAYVIGIDISPIMPEYVPINLECQIGDCNKEWSFPESFYDYTHGRDLSGSFDWRELTGNVFKSLKPGGLAEFNERAIDFKIKNGTLKEGSYIGAWIYMCLVVGKRRETPFMVTNDTTLQDEMAAAGFKDIEVFQYDVRCTFSAPRFSATNLRESKVPVGSCFRSKEDKELGTLAQAILTGDVMGTILRTVTEDVGWSEQKAYAFAAELRNEILSYSAKYNVRIRRTVVTDKRPERR